MKTMMPKVTMGCRRIGLPATVRPRFLSVDEGWGPVKQFHIGGDNLFVGTVQGHVENFMQQPMVDHHTDERPRRQQGSIGRKAPSSILI